MTEFDKHGTAQLAESVDTRGEDPPQAIEFQRREIFYATEPSELKERRFDLTIFNGSSDMTYSGLTGREVCQVAEDMIRLVGGTMRVEPPADPEIKF